MRARTIAIALCLAATPVLVAACEKQSSQQPAATAQAQNQVVVPAGTELAVRLDGTLGNDSRPGDFFSAKLVHSVKGPAGMVIAPAGAIVRGRVVEVIPQPTPSLRLKFESIQVESGTIPIEATVQRTQPEAWLTGTSIYQRDLGYNAVLSPTPHPPRKSAVGGGPTAPGTGTQGTAEPQPTQPQGASSAQGATEQAPPAGPTSAPKRFVLPAGTTLSLILTQPIHASEVPAMPPKEHKSE